MGCSQALVKVSRGIDGRLDEYRIPTAAVGSRYLLAISMPGGESMLSTFRPKIASIDSAFPLSAGHIRSTELTGMNAKGD